MSFHHQQIAPPNAWAEFEDLCLALFQAQWQDADVQKNGRPGQKQAGVDIVGTNHAQGSGLWAVQCKLKEAARGLTHSEITAELAMADQFTPTLTNKVRSSERSDASI
jgi:hypothetical protein